MILTTFQAKEAILEIIARTDWTYAKIARESGLHPYAIEKVVTGQTRTMTDKSIKKLNKLYKYVIKHTDAPA